MNQWLVDKLEAFKAWAVSHGLWLSDDPQKIAAARMFAKKAAVGAAAAATGTPAPEMPEGFIIEQWLLLKEAERSAQSQFAKLAKRQLGLKGEPPPLYPPFLGDQERKALFASPKDYAQDQRSGTYSEIGALRQAGDQFLKLLGDKEVPIEALPQIRDMLPYDIRKDIKTISAKALRQLLPFETFDTLPNQVAAHAAAEARRFNLHRKLLDGVREQAAGRGMRQGNADQLYLSIREEITNAGGSFDDFVEKAANNSSLVGKKVGRAIKQRRESLKEHQREWDRLGASHLEALSPIFGGLEFKQNPLTLRIYTEVDSANEAVAKAIRGIFDGCVQGIYHTEFVSLSDKEKKPSAFPSVDNLFRSYQPDMPFIPSKSAIGAQVYLELKPQYAKVLLDVYGEHGREIRSGKTSNLLDCYEVLFEYGRTQARLMGGKPIGWAERFAEKRETKTWRG